MAAKDAGGGRCGEYSESVSHSHYEEKTDIPVGGSALQCAARTPHDPSHPSPTGDLTGKALALRHPAPATMRKTANKG